MLAKVLRNLVRSGVFQQAENQSVRLSGGIHPLLWHGSRYPFASRRIHTFGWPPTAIQVRADPPASLLDRGVLLRLALPVPVESDSGQPAERPHRKGDQPEALHTAGWVLRAGVVTAYVLRDCDVRCPVCNYGEEHVCGVRACMGAIQSDDECMADAPMVSGEFR